MLLLSRVKEIMRTGNKVSCRQYMARQTGTDIAINVIATTTRIETPIDYQGDEYVIAHLSLIVDGDQIIPGFATWKDGQSYGNRSVRIDLPLLETAVSVGSNHLGQVRDGFGKDNGFVMDWWA